MQAFIIGGLCIVNLQTSPKTVAKIKRISKKEKKFSRYFALYSVQRWVLSSQTTIDGVKT